jgi:protein O-mannosyl-transferase
MVVAPMKQAGKRTGRTEPVSGKGGAAATGRVLAAALALLAALPYLVGGVSRTFITLDDDHYIYENPQVRRGLTPETALWALTTTEHANWYPLRRLSHLVDVSLFGLDARGHHLVSVAWHVAAAVLLFAALRLMTGTTWRSFMVAGLFASHPLQVESVAWAAERSNVQAGLFFALALLLWARYARRRGTARYVAVVAACALGVVAKPVLMTLPLVLLLLDFWPLGRMSAPGAAPWRISPGLLRRRLKEQAPLFLLAAGSAAVAVLAHRQAGGITALEALPLGIRLGNAALSYVRYVGAALWPANLALLYPHPGRNLSIGAALAAALLLAAATALVLARARRRPWLAVGWLWFAGMLVPMIGIVQFGSHARADRFFYLPSIGLFTALVWFAAELPLTGWRRSAALGGFAGSALAALTVASAVQASYWKDSETLFRRTLAITKDNGLIQNNLAVLLQKMGRHEEAVAHAREAVRLRPADGEAFANLGVSLAALGRLEEAIASSREAVRLRPDSANTHAALGNALAAAGRHAAAVASYREALRLGTDRPEIPYNLGNSLVALGRHEEAVASYREALGLRPDHANAHANLAGSLAALGRREEAVASYREALRLRSDFADWYNLGLALESLGRPAEAVSSYREALKIRPNHAETQARIERLLGSGRGR